MCVDADTSAERAAELMVEFGVGALPVVAPTTLRLVGSLSYVDLLRGFHPPVDSSTPVAAEVASAPERPPLSSSLRE